MAFRGNCVSLACVPLRSVLLRAELVSPCLMKNLSAWLDSRSAKLWVTAEAFFAEVRQGVGKEGFRGV